MSAKTIESGTRYGRLVVVSRGTSFTTGKDCRKVSTSVCVCDCGNSKTITNNSLKSGLTNSCGCLQKEIVAVLGKETKHKRTDPQKQAWSGMYKSYKAGANVRNLCFEINFSLFKSICFKNCVYCGAQPREISTWKNRYTRHESDNCLIDMEFADQKIIYANGIDRLDNNIGYVESNIAPCCSLCNKLKGKMSMDQWTSWLSAVRNNFNPNLFISARIDAAIIDVDSAIESSGVAHDES